MPIASTAAIGNVKAEQAGSKVFMSTQPRETKVFAALMVSMSALAFVLVSLGYNPPPAGAFCLSSYNRMLPVREALAGVETSELIGWVGIEVRSVSTANGGTEGVFGASGSAGHFIVCNGQVGSDGRIEFTQNWLEQRTLGDSGDGIIHIIVLTGAPGAVPSDFQIRRTVALVEELGRKLSIAKSQIRYPRQFLF